MASGYRRHHSITAKRTRRVCWCCTGNGERVSVDCAAYGAGQCGIRRSVWPAYIWACNCQSCRSNRHTEDPAGGRTKVAVSRECCLHTVNSHRQHRGVEGGHAGGERGCAQRSGSTEECDRVSIGVEVLTRLGGQRRSQRQRTSVIGRVGAGTDRNARRRDTALQGNRICFFDAVDRVSEILPHHLIRTGYERIRARHLNIGIGFRFRPGPVQQCHHRIARIIEHSQVSHAVAIQVGGRQ